MSKIQCECFKHINELSFKPINKFKIEKKIAAVFHFFFFCSKKYQQRSISICYENRLRNAQEKSGIVCLNVCFASIAVRFYVVAYSLTAIERVYCLNIFSVMQARDIALILHA